MCDKRSVLWIQDNSSDWLYFDQTATMVTMPLGNGPFANYAEASVHFVQAALKEQS